MLPIQAKIIIDFTLGDGNLRYRWENSKLPNFKFSHSSAQLAYVDHKASILDRYEIPNKRCVNSNKGYTQGKTETHTVFTPGLACNAIAYKHMYNKKVKTIDKNLLKRLDAYSLAYWFMDDGDSCKATKIITPKYTYTYASPIIRSFRIATCNHTFEENKLIVDWLKERFNINATVQTHRKVYPLLTISQVESKQRFVELIKPYIIPSMEYKISGNLSTKGLVTDRKLSTGLND